MKFRTIDPVCDAGTGIKSVHVRRGAKYSCPIVIVVAIDMAFALIAFIKI